MNLSQLSTEEIIHYIEAGIIENVPGEVVLKIIEKVKEGEFSRGWEAALDESYMRNYEGG